MNFKTLKIGHLFKYSSRTRLDHDMFDHVSTVQR